MNELFNEFNDINQKLEQELIEISVRQHQISYIFEGNTLGLKDIETLTCLTLNYDLDRSYLMTQEGDFLVVTFDSWEDKSTFFKKYIKEISDKICQCPAIEFVVSAQYIKCYLDKGGLTVDDLVAYEKIMGATGTLEVTTQRPYLLFINESFYLEVDNEV